MVDNEEERKNMKRARYLFLVLFSSLPVMWGCSRRTLLDDYPVTGINISLNWEGVTDHLPEGVRVIFYPKDDQGRKIDTYLPVKGGEVKVPPGHYSAVIYNYDTEVVQVKDEGSYETIMACTGNCTGLGISETENMVWGPDAFYMLSLNDVEVGKENELPMLKVKLKAVVTTYTFAIKTEGLKNVASVIGSVSGMAECYHLGKDAGVCRFAPIYCETGKGDGVIKGSFTCFGHPKLTQARADIARFLELIIVRVDGSKQEAKVEITEAVKPPDDGDEPGEGDHNPQPLEIEIKLPEDEKIVMDDVEVPPSGGGGIGGNVDNWENEEDVILPVN